MGSQSGDVEDGGVIFSFGHWKIRRLSELEVILYFGSDVEPVKENP